MTKLNDKIREETHQKYISDVNRNSADPTLFTFCTQIIIEFTNNLYYGHHQAKESEVDQEKHSEEQYLGK
jgi:hypothetical protein